MDRGGPYIAGGARVGGLGGVSGPSDLDPMVPERRATRRGVGGL